jgi:azurin
MTQKTISTRARLFVPLLALTLAGAACSQPEPAESGTAPATSTAPASGGASPAATVHDGRKIEITGDDTLKFDVVELRAKPGERLSVTLINKGKTPKFSMGHNWVLLASGLDLDTFVIAAAEAPTTDYVPASRQSEILAATKLLGPAEQDTATFNAPATPGRYEFICSFPGHFQVGMRGVLIVE